jgi:epoxyqueuosine reductase
MAAMSERRELTERVKQRANELGFTLAGVTTPDPPPNYPAYLDWVAAGRHGEMGYLASERNLRRRGDLYEILPECKSVLVLGVPYWKPEMGDAGEGRGRVAAYAWGDDYHEVLKPRLQELVSYIEEQAGEAVPNRWYTDTGPILERDLLQRAGLGWIGKNTCLIDPQRGSYFLLAEILLGVELEADPPLTSDQCGSCRRCIEACPTACILEDRTIDARRCISYLTIELKGAIPLELRPQIGEWVFGCDVCQQVCPWNVRFAETAGDPAFAPREGVPLPVLQDEIRLSRQEFNARFKDSPVKRSKRRGYLRNVAVAMGNTRNPDMTPALRQALGDEEPLVRAHAAWALGQIGGEAARIALVEALPEERDKDVIDEMRAALEMIETGDTMGY